MHHLRVVHPLSMVPILGSKFEFVELPGNGSSNTIQKTGHEITNKRHRATYGSQARHISDLSDPDANYFVLLGGQDGWLGSKNLLDQVPLWREGKLIQFPLNKATLIKQFRRQTVLQPQ
jgi:penicillin amidase